MTSLRSFVVLTRACIPCEKMALKLLKLSSLFVAAYRSLMRIRCGRADGNTVSGITYYEQGETPGLGGEVENPSWRAQFVGKKLFDENHKPAIKVVKGGAPEGTEAVLMVFLVQH